MIKVLKNKLYDNESIDTFGYMSLGSIKLSEKTKYPIFRRLYLKCSYLEKEFDLILFNLFLSEEIIILGNLDCLPGNFIADKDKFHEELVNLILSGDILFNNVDDILYDEGLYFGIDSVGKNMTYHYDYDTSSTTNNTIGIC